MRPGGPCYPCPCVCQHGTHDASCRTPCAALSDYERRQLELPAFTEDSMTAEELRGLSFE